ncbi:hypothetical protein [Rhodococcus sp. AG1013]|uniref:hypothetical protein n=1 Tax=unclassified Rhodococcus (in: high G+C Gram-positive bacteria) TaxID=192944 RepID=UPI000E0CA272|nr:hypothetical protein [Rhodococcus sp. AG1013]RDI33670.1 hypothetical protein DEU38_10225 [Rhodococcus sp. AG1013]
MTTNARLSLTAVATAFAGVLGTFVLISRPQWGPLFSASERQLDDWNAALPTGVAVGCVVAVLAYGALQRAGSARPPWITAVVATAVLIAARLAVSGVSDLDQLTVLYYTKCVAGGVLLGAVVAAAWSRALPRLALTIAVAATFVVAHTAHSDWTPSTSMLGEPFWWVLVPAIVLAAVCAAVDTDTPARADAGTVREAIAAVSTLAVGHRLLSAWIDGQSGSRFRLWIVVGLCLVLVVALTEFWARRLDSPFLLAATAVAATAPMVTTLLADDHLRLQPWLPVAVGVTAVAAGVAIALRRPSPLIGLCLLAVIPLWTAVDPTATDSRAWFLVELAVLGVGIGLALGSTLPDGGAVAALGLVVPLLSLVFTTLVGVTTSFVVYSGSYEPLPDVPFNMPNGLSTSEAIEIFVDSDPWPSNVTFDRGAGVALLLVVVFCALAIRGLRARLVDQVQFPEPREDEP